MTVFNPALSIGPRIRAARDAVGLTQAHLSDALGFNDRQTLSDIEKGKRAVKPQELVTLSEVLDRDLEYFLDPFSVSGEAKYNWRASPDMTQTTLDAFEARADRWIGLLRWLRARKGMGNPLKLSLRLESTATFEQAQERAETLSHMLALGQTPATKLASAIEEQLDIAVLFVDTIAKTKRFGISGATCHLQDMTAILINRHEPLYRQNFDMAHELFHALTWDAMQPEHRESNCIEHRKGGKRIEQLADNFAAALLMPRTSLEQLIAPNRRSNLRHLTATAKVLQVTPSALAWRLYNLQWIDTQMLQALKSQPNGLTTKSIPKRFSRGYVGLLHEAIDQGQLSARKAAKALGLSLTDLKRLFKEHSFAVPFDL